MAAALPVPKGKSFGEKVLFWFILLFLIISLVMCGFLLLRMAGPKVLRSLGMVTRVMVQVGLLPKTVLTAAAPVTGAVSQGAKLGRKGAKPQDQAREGDPTRAAAACTPDDPVASAQPGELSLLDPTAAFDLAAGRAAEARGLAVGTVMPVPAAGSAQFLEANAAGGLPPVVPPAAAPTDAAAVPPAAGAPPAPAPAPAAPEIPSRALAAPAGPPPVIYSVELGFFLATDTALAYATELQKRGIAVALVTQPDAGGRTWTYVRSGRFLDGAQALTYAQDLETRYRLPGVVVTEKQEPVK